jgi:predicted nuclease of predicted toxin-antitoxin system
MKLVVDQGLPRSAVPILRAAGHDAVHVGDVGMARAHDDEILAFALEREAVVVTLDADFHALLARSGARQPSVVRLRVQGKNVTDLCALLLSVLAACATQLQAGAVVTADDTRARMRRLPLE